MGAFCFIEGVMIMRKMKKENIYKFLYIVAALLDVGFAIAFGVDAYKYNAGGYLGSAPLYAYALVDAVEYLLPSLAFFIAAIICKKKFVKKENNNK